MVRSLKTGASRVLLLFAMTRKKDLMAQQVQKANERRHGAGIATTLVGASLWGVSGTCMQYLTGDGGMTPAMVTLLRVIVGGILLLALAWLGQKGRLAALLRNRSNILPMLLFALTLYANQLCYAKTVQLTNAGTATVLQMLETVFVMIFVCVASRKPPRLREISGLVMAFAATFLIATQGNPVSLSMSFNGLLWGLATGASAAAYILVPKQTGLFERYGSLVVLAAGMLLSIVFALPGYLLQGGSGTQLAHTLAALGAFGWIVFLIGLALVGTALAFGLYFYGVSVVGPVLGSLLAAIEPVSATALSAIFLGTVVTGFDVAGIVLMCTMVALVTAPESPRKRHRE